MHRINLLWFVPLLLSNFFTMNQLFPAILSFYWFISGLEIHWFFRHLASPQLSVVFCSHLEQVDYSFVKSLDLGQTFGER